MQNNPGYIKWFVSALQVGTRPEEILDQSGLFLDYCMSNAYKYLADNAKTILKAMMTSTKHLGQPELNILTGIEVDELQRALHQLLATNMIQMKTFGSDGQSETTYGISELARLFLMKHHPTTHQEYELFKKRQRDIDGAGTYLEQAKSNNPFSATSISTKSKGDIVVAKYLLDALTFCKSKNFTSAHDLISKARGLSPYNYEVHRVDAWVNAAAGNFPAAEESYTTAIELESNSAPLRMFFGGFLMRHAHDNERALEQYRIAGQLYSDSVHIKLETARLYLFMGKSTEAKNLLDEIHEDKATNAWLRRKTLGLYLQYFQRMADFAAGTFDYTNALKYIEDLIACYNNSPPELRDQHMKDTLKRAYSTTRRCEIGLGDVHSREKIANICAELIDILQVWDIDNFVSARSPQIRGHVYKIVQGKSYCFLKGEDNREYFLHHNNILNFTAASLSEGIAVAFTIGENDRGICAVNCTILNN